MLKSEPTKPAKLSAVAWVLALTASHDADRLNDLRHEVNTLTRQAGHAIDGDAEPCNAMPKLIQAAVGQIHAKYPTVFPMETSLYAASILMENHAKLLRDRAFEPLQIPAMRMAAVLNEVGKERERQDEKWGEQNMPSVVPAPEWMEALDNATEMIAQFHCQSVGFRSNPDAARDACKRAFKQKEGTWAHVLMEEVAEALGAPNEAERRAELVQVAAVAVAQIECIDRNAAKPEEPAR